MKLDRTKQQLLSKGYDNETERLFIILLNRTSEINYFNYDAFSYFCYAK